MAISNLITSNTIYHLVDNRNGKEIGDSKSEEMFGKITSPYQIDAIHLLQAGDLLFDYTSKSGKDKWWKVIRREVRPRKSWTSSNIVCLIIEPTDIYDDGRRAEMKNFLEIIDTNGNLVDYKQFGEVFASAVLTPSIGITIVDKDNIRWKVKDIEFSSINKYNPNDGTTTKGAKCKIVISKMGIDL